MFKAVVAGLSLSVFIVGSALAHDTVEGKEASAPQTEPGPAAVPGPPSIETPEAKAVVQYKFGVNGFLRGEGTGNFSLSDFSYQPKHSEGRFLYRVKPYAYWHPTDYLDLHLEGQGYGFAGEGRDDHHFSLYQGYLEAKIPNSDLLALKAGRQDFSYGSNFMLGPDSFYDGLSFDAARLRVRPVDFLSVDLFGGSYAYPSADGVKGNLSGAYATWTISDGNGLEGYFLRDTGSTERHSGEFLHSYGLRGTAKAGAVSVEVEPVLQSGKVYNASTGGNDSINAFGGHADLTAEYEAGRPQKVWAGYAIGSGSRAAAEGGSTRYQFRNPNNDTAIVGDMNAFGDLSGVNVADHHASGLQIYTLGWGIDLTKQLNFSATGHYYRAYAVERGFSKNIGIETDFTLTYNFEENYALLLGYDHLFTGPFFRDASGSGADAHYGYAMLQFNLEKAKLKSPKKGA